MQIVPPKPIQCMDFWSHLDSLVTLPADTALPDVIIVGLPDGAVVKRAILTLKYSAKKDISGADNKITAGTITSREKLVPGIYATGIYLRDGESAVAADTKEGGDVHVGNSDISGTDSGITGNCHVQSVFASVTTTGASIELYDVQLGIRIYFM